MAVFANDGVLAGLKIRHFRGLAVHNFTAKSKSGYKNKKKTNMLTSICTIVQKILETTEEKKGSSELLLRKLKRDKFVKS